MLVLVASLLVLVIAGPALNPQVNQEINYAVSGTVDSKGRNGASVTQASIGTLQGVFASKCLSSNGSLAVYVANMFDVTVAVSQGAGADELRKLTDSSDEPLGYDMYYTQTPDGLIPEVQYDSRDSLYYVQVKLAAINSLQTSVSAGSVRVDDPTGVHFSAFAVSELTVSSTFSAASYLSFMDPSVSAKNVQLQATSSAVFHPAGYIVSASNQQDVALVRGQTASAPAVASDDSASGFDLFMASTGRLSLNATTPAGTRLASRSRSLPSGLLRGSLSSVARTLHAVQKEMRAKEVAAALPSLLATNSIAAIAPHLHSSQLRKQLRRLGRSVALPHVDRFLRVCAMAGMADALVRFVPSHRDLVEQALWYAPRHCSAPALCTAFRSSPALFAHLRCPGSKPVVASAQPQLSLPFNRTGSGTVSVGGKTLGLSFTASYLVGTNLDCKNPAFAYEATADIQASINLFGETDQAFDANFVYGQNGASPLADVATLTAFGKPVWSQHVPVVSYCRSQSLPIGQVERGLHVSHTVWVSIVPVSFTAAADLKLALSWQWSLCSNDLSASVGVTPSAEVDVSGSTLVDLLVLRAGVDLSGTLAASVVPQVFVAGTACSAGVDAVVSKPGDSGELSGYYQWRKCKWLFFDCHWEDQHKRDFWTHQGAPSQSTLFNKTFSIA